MSTQAQQNYKEEIKHPWEDFDYRLETTDLDLGLSIDGRFWESDDFVNSDAPISIATALDEHNYTSKLTSDVLDEELPGVCLHVNKHRVSLEFCAACHNNASETWKEHKLD
ncbi:hypothetical protein RN001_004320 [Aquatica leii]|uniref:Uncharacterized protein n=1 Tax=Aquatica leii TaxID=1421715 RepID=A0AAN7PI71_9COLE|nr:hypothetical protein RN001_004320 [Aquatica leii]